MSMRGLARIATSVLHILTKCGSARQSDPPGALMYPLDLCAPRGNRPIVLDVTGQTMGAGDARES